MFLDKALLFRAGGTLFLSLLLGVMYAQIIPGNPSWQHSLHSWSVGMLVTLLLSGTAVDES